MSRSDLAEVAARIRDGVCVRGCTLRDVHYAACPDSGIETTAGAGACRGCAPSPVPAGSVICTRCFGRTRALLRDAPDLLGRVRSLSDPTKALQIAAVKVSSRPVDAVAPVGADLLDAADQILRNLRAWAISLDVWAVTGARRTAGLDALAAYEVAATYTRVILDRLEEITADAEQALRLAEAVLVLHPEQDGHRAQWSIADAAARWGVERRDRHVHPDVDEDPDQEISVKPIREWYDPLITIKDVATRHEVTERAVRRWIQDGDLAVTTRLRLPTGHVQKWVRASAAARAAKQARDRQSPGRAKAVRDTPEPDEEIASAVSDTLCVHEN